jgi:hypothetical protein
MSKALRGANETSLILVDEFGKGTSQTDGISLLAASVEHWIQKYFFFEIVNRFRYLFIASLFLILFRVDESCDHYDFFFLTFKS